MAAGRKKSLIWEFFSVAEDSRFAKCKKCNIEVPRGGQSTKTFTPTNLVQTKPGHEEEYERYNKLKTEEKKQSSTTDGT